MNAITKDFTDAIEAQFGKLNSEVQAALTEAKAAQGIVFELEQKMARRGGGENAPGANSWGDQFVQADGLKSFADAQSSRPGRFRMDVKAITTSSTSGGPVSPQAYRDGIVALPQRRLLVRNLLPVVGISTVSVEYPKQTTRTNNAAMVPEGTLKPESDYGFTMQTATPKVIAHWVTQSVQILEDAPQLRGIIDGELRYGLALKEDQQLINGSGTGENLTGLVTAATAYVAPFGPAGTETMLDQIALAILQATLADYVPSGIVMHPSDWMRIRLLKDGDGKYLLGDPGANVEPRLFGLPVVATTGMAIDKFLVGDFQAAATLYDRWQPRVEVSTEHADYFVKNLVAVRAEERLALAIKQAGALIYGDFGNVA